MRPAWQRVLTLAAVGSAHADKHQAALESGISSTEPDLTLRLMVEAEIPMLHERLQRPHVVQW